MKPKEPWSDVAPICVRKSTRREVGGCMMCEPYRWTYRVVFVVKFGGFLTRICRHHASLLADTLKKQL